MKLFSVLLGIFLSFIVHDIYAKQHKPVFEPVRKTYHRRVEVVDPRVEALRGYFERKQSPLVGISEMFIRVADKYKLDWTLLPAIAGVESGFEKAGNLYDFNPFGYICKSGPCVFDSFDDAIKTVGKTIGAGSAYTAFQESGSVSLLAPVYNYVSPEDWTSKIKYFQMEIK